MLKVYVNPLVNVMTSSGPGPLYTQPLYEALLFAAIIASRNEQLALLTFSSLVTLTVMDAAKAGATGSTTSSMAMIAMAAQNLLKSEGEKLIVRITLPFEN